ncbi:outer membrane protein assembly factor BamD [Cytophagales bacterium LB-30]|uniref:Outer membrane protein assembly factor BamD n=1 Tax=Shiella aurantiaca TaxID=3058365 RepID=A0ABT8F856_9BACT|nr:outer membrane protein assembly factor BamD [Shiella aurantiaca]MDN4166564.1 outer membrane protein assembly factor BamD [Shiella aurantiaca]
MLKTRSLFILFVLITVVISGCSKFRKIQKSDDWKLKYEAAIKYYEKKDYYRASVLFDEIMPIVRGSEESEMIQYYYAYCHFHQGDYILSAHYFKTFYETFSRSTYAQEANYMYAYSLYMQSPDANLDQTSTRQAIESMQIFINRYPSSTYREEASRLINEMQVKLETKAYENTKLFFNLKAYRKEEYLKAAMIAFENFQKDFPDSKFNEEIAYYQIEAQYLLAEESVLSKKRERYNQTIEFYLSFVDGFPESKWLKEAEPLYEKSLKALGKIKEENNL